MKILLILLILQSGYLSRFVSEREAFYSKTAVNKGIVNIPNPTQRKLIVRVCKTYFDSLRLDIGKPLYINSLYRSPALNAAVGGAKNSDHMVTIQPDGHAIVSFDIDNDGKNSISNRDLFFKIKASKRYWKLIWEFGVPPTTVGGTASTGGPAWCHVGYSTDFRMNVGRYTYIAKRVKNRTIYIIYK